MSFVGSFSGSLIFRSSIGSICSSCASSSIADSRRERADGFARAPASRYWRPYPDRPLSARYRNVRRRIEMPRRKRALLRVSPAQQPSPSVPVWISAVSFPSFRAPSATRCSEIVRPPTMRKTPSRDNDQLHRAIHHFRRRHAQRACCSTAHFAAEPTAHERRHHPHLLRLQIEIHTKAYAQSG